MSQHIGPRTISAIGGSVKRVGNYRVHTFPSELVTDGLVLNLDAGDPRSYPSSGTTWTDLSGNGNNGTLIDSPVYSNADGGSLVFGSPTTTKVLVNTSGYGSGSFTISMWFNIDTIPANNYHMLLGASNYAGGFGIAHYLYADTIRTWLSGGGGNIYNSGSILTAGTWYNLVITREYGVAWKWYLNGSLINTYTGNLTENYTSPNSYIGNHYNSISYPFFGKVSVLRTYNRALSAAEVAQNYDALRVRYGTYTNTFTPICAGGEGKVEVLCVAGGGGGGGYRGGGGGGAGGLVYNSSYSVTSNSGIQVSVGKGGKGGEGDNISRGQNGDNSVFSTLTSIGGGGGGTTGFDGANGGSGGGARHNTNQSPSSGTPGQGNSGGRGNGTSTSGSGGGGAGEPGEDNVVQSNAGGNGGNGLAYSITGTSTYYAAGGGGGGGETGVINPGGLGGGGTGRPDTAPGGNGTPNTGGGGGGGGISPYEGGNGSNGIVIVRYPASDYNVELLIVGGGGAGGGSILSQGGGGGGGAGGLVYYSSYPVSSGTKYSINVGAGGLAVSAVDGVNGSNGNNSVFGSLTAFGGGGGSYGNGSGTGSNGGSGGGGGYRGYNTVSNGGFGISGQGNNGGGVSSVSASGAGGGGAGGVGQSNTGAGGGVGGVGGVGLTYAITGSPVTYAKGGQGGGSLYITGTANTGNGGDGVYADENSNKGYNGGSGIVIIAYKGPQRGIGGTVDTTSRPGYTLHRFTTTGTDFFIP